MTQDKIGIFLWGMSAGMWLAILLGLYFVNYNFLPQTNQPIVLTEVAALNTVIPKKHRWLRANYRKLF